MGGGLMQLVAYGAQDIYLTGNPQITFFKVVYRRHTNFSMESIEQTINGSVSASSSITSTISRNGDLVSRLYVQHDTAGSSTGAAVNNYGYHILSEVECEIGGQRIDRHYNHWLNTWTELSEPNPTGSTAAISGGMDSNSPTKFQRMACAGGCEDTAADTGPLFIPLQFWFCRNPGLALPLIALQYHEVKIKITFDAALVGTDVKLFADYIYLDTDERRRFAQVSHEYLIEQVQHFKSSAEANVELNFNHPIKELVWTGEYTSGTGTNAGSSAQLQGEDVDGAFYCTGPLGATLYVSSDVIDTDFTAKISDVYPTGEVRIIQDASFRMRWRLGGTVPTSMENGTIYKIDVNLWNTSYVFAPGHSLRVSISSSNYPRFSANPNNGLLLSDPNYPGESIVAQNRLHHSAQYPSHVTLSRVTRADLPPADILENWKRLDLPESTKDFLRDRTNHFFENSAKLF